MPGGGEEEERVRDTVARQVCTVGGSLRLHCSVSFPKNSERDWIPKRAGSILGQRRCKFEALNNGQERAPLFSLWPEKRKMFIHRRGRKDGGIWCACVKICSCVSACTP